MVSDLILDPTNDTILPILENFLDRPRRLKYDEYNGQLYHIVWTNDALILRKERQLELRRQKYQASHPPRPKPNMSLYLRKKQQRIQEKAKYEKELREKHMIDLLVKEVIFPNQMDIHGNLISIQSS